MKRIINKIANLFGYEVKNDSYLKINIIAFTNALAVSTKQIIIEPFVLCDALIIIY